MVNSQSQTTGIKVLGWVYILTGVTGMFTNTVLFLNPPELLLNRFRYDPMFLAKLTSAISFGFSVASLAIGINLLKFRELWRKITLVEAVAMIIFTSTAFLYSNAGFNLLAAIPLIEVFALVYLTRPSVKVQFS